MQLIFLYGPVAAGKLTVARELAGRTGYALFHNHLIVDAVAAVFPFGSPSFMRLRERFWMETFEAAAAESRSLIFTFAPEPTVAADFPQRVQMAVEAAGGRVVFVALTVPPEEQDRRLNAPSRSAFGKLTSLELLHSLRAQFDAAMDAMPAPMLTIDTAQVGPDEAAEAIDAAVRP
jgi:hypothetical protein